MKCVIAALTMLVMAPPSALPAAELHVTPSGNDGNPGTSDQPFRTLQAAAERLQAGDTCVVHAGTYRETVRPRNAGAKGKPIRFQAAAGARPVIDGTEPLAGPWSVFKGRIYRAQTEREFIQVFADGQMLVEARWPNRRFPQQLWERDRWARAGLGSRYGRMVDTNLVQTGIDWTGAIAVLNVAHQFFTWTRPVLRHGKGSDRFEYAKDLEGITSYADQTKPWEDDRYYLVGKLDALDEPGEWFLDRPAHTLYLWLPDGSDPSAHRIAVKARDYGLEVKGKNYVEVRGFDFVGCAFDFERCNGGTVEDCRLFYPAFARRLNEPGCSEDRVGIRLEGDHHTVRRCLIAWSSTGGLTLTGRSNLVEDCLLHDVSWDGSLRHVAIVVNNPGEASQGSVVRHCTVYNGGNALIDFRGYGHVIEYNHTCHGGLACKDVALIYTGLPTCAGGIVRYNWVHGCRTEEGGGLGIRGDDQTRRLTVHHNVVWDCARDGIIVKGDTNVVCNNTVFNIGSSNRTGNFVNLPTTPEPRKYWRDQWPLLDKQNLHSVIANNAALTITGDNKGTPYAFAQNMANNYQGKDLLLMDPAHFDFRPQAPSPLVDAGKVLAGITDGFLGKAPDIGAYESGGSPWRAGITWKSADNSFYGALFDRSPEGLPAHKVVDTRSLDDKDRDKDRDGGPITRTFSARDRAELQRIAWESKILQAPAQDSP